MTPEKQFQSELIRGCSQYRGLVYKLPDPPKGPQALFHKAGIKPYDMQWFLPNGKIVVIELKAVKGQTFTICKDGVSNSLKEHQLQYLTELSEMGHEAWVGINFQFAASEKFKKGRTGKNDTYYPRCKNSFNVAYCVTIEFLQYYMQEGETTIKLEEIENQACNNFENVKELHRKRIGQEWMYDPENLHYWISNKERD